MIGRLRKARKPRIHAPRRFGERVGRFFHRLFLCLVVIGVLALVGFVGFAFYRFLYRSDFFKVGEVLISGANGRVEHRIRRFLLREHLSDENLWKLDTEAVRATIEEIPKVQNAAVTKRYPNQLLIEVRQRQIAALVLNDPILAIDAERVVVEAFTTRHPRALQYPFITGLDLARADLGDEIQSEDLTKALFLLSSLARRAPTLFSRISEVHCGTQNNLTLLLKGGTEIRFGSGNPIEKMPALDTFLSHKGEPEQFAYIDLRFDGQVPWKPIEFRTTE